MVTLVTMLASAPTLAQSAVAEAPLAIPVANPSPGAQGEPRPPPPRVTVRVSSRGDQSRALDAQRYRDEYLSVRRGAQVRTAGHLAPSHGMPDDPIRYMGYWPAQAMVMERVGVVQGHRWLDVPELLTALGEEGWRRDIQRRISNNRNASAFLQGMAVVGVGGMVAGLVGADRSKAADAAQSWKRLTGVGAALTVGGVVTSAIPARRANRLRYDVASVMPAQELQSRVHRHNRELAEELGITPDAAGR